VIQRASFLCMILFVQRNQSISINLMSFVVIPRLGLRHDVVYANRTRKDSKSRCAFNPRDMSNRSNRKSLKWFRPLSSRKKIKSISKLSSRITLALFSSNDDENIPIFFEQENGPKNETNTEYIGHSKSMPTSLLSCENKDKTDNRDVEESSTHNIDIREDYFAAIDSSTDSCPPKVKFRNNSSSLIEISKSEGDAMTNDFIFLDSDIRVFSYTSNIALDGKDHAATSITPKSAGVAVEETKEFSDKIDMIISFPQSKTIFREMSSITISSQIIPSHEGYDRDIKVPPYSIDSSIMSNISGDTSFDSIPVRSDLMPNDKNLAIFR